MPGKEGRLMVEGMRGYCQWVNKEGILPNKSKFQNRNQMEQPKILVAIRKRPLSKKEASKGETDIISVKNGDTVIVSEYKQKVDLTKYIEETIFNFDFAFPEETNNEEIYDLAVRPLVDSAFQGAKVTCFAYGQTGSGKTFTMNGVMHQGIPGLYTLGANDIFEYLASPQYRHLKAKLSFFQIYCGKLYDLLNKRAELKLREDNKNNINIIGLEEASVNSSEEFIEYLAQGSKERVTSQNSANADSSRSHAILQITLKDGKKLFGKISFIDLAGNQRGADHMDMSKQTRIDGAEINKSLLSLKECIRALDQGKGHTPFRGSKLTMVLKDSFVGFCRTVMIGNVSPSSASSENTLNTLRYADRVKQLRKPQQGQTKEDIKARQMMLPRQNKNAIKIMINNDDDAQDIADKREEARKQYGIMEEQLAKKNAKEDLSVRKKQETKSSSLAKNPIGASLGNKQPNTIIPSSNTNRPINPINANRKGPGMDNPNESQRENYPGMGGLSRYNSSQYGVAPKREEPMEIESPSVPYYLPTNKSSGNPTVNNRLMGNQVPARGYQQHGSNNGYAVMSQSHNMSNNCSNLSMNSNMNLSQANHRQPPSYQPNFNHSQPQSQPNSFYNNYNQGPKNNNYFNQNPSINPNAGYNNISGYNSNPGYNPNQAYNTPNYRQAQQNYILPENWEDMAATVVSSKDPEFTQHIITQMNEKLFLQEEELVRNHSDSLRREIDIIKSQMSQLNEMQMDRSKITSRGYVQFMQQSIQEKISLLQQLRERMINFTYKLDAMEEIERNGKTMEIDEQLLDDIN